jgi:predicted metal-dependent phosphotriesterase family hydrolase
MVERGFEEQLLLGMDVTRDRMPAYGGEHGLGYIARIFTRLLRKRVGDRAIECMTTDNPRRALQFRSPHGGPGIQEREP